MKRDYWRGFGKYNMPKPGIDTFFASDDWNKIICENVNANKVRTLNEHHTLSISPIMGFEDTYNESAGGKRFIVRYVPKFERTYEIFQEHEDYVNMSVLVRDVLYMFECEAREF